MNRRRVLTSAALTLSIPLGGCSRLTGGDPQGTASLSTRFWLERVSVAESERESIDPIDFADLSDGEQDVVRTALDAGEYTEAPSEDSTAIERLRDRIEARTGNGETLEVYLVREGTYYRVGFVDGDHIIAHPDQ